MNRAYPFSSAQWHGQYGASLVEAMLACALGLFLISGFIQIYLAVQKTFTLQQAIVTIQENARFAIHFLNQDIRMAGYSGCDATTALTNNDLAIHGYQNNPPDFYKGKVLKDTDSIVIGRCETENGKEVFKQLAFFIGATSRKNVLGKSVYALYVNPEGGDKSELVSNVDNMQIHYGIGSVDQQDVTQYLLANQVTDWNNVRTVEISLLFSSPTPVLAQPEAYTFADSVFPKDRFLHREWHTYITLRER